MTRPVNFSPVPDGNAALFGQPKGLEYETFSALKLFSVPLSVTFAFYLEQTAAMHGMQSTSVLCSQNFPGKDNGYCLSCRFLLPDPGTEPRSLASPTLSCGFFTRAPPGNP